MLVLKTTYFYEINGMNDNDVNDCIAVLLEEKGGLKTEEKYVLIQILLHFGLSGVVDKKVKELTYLFEMSEAVFRRSRDSLMASGWLDESRMSVKGRGRAIRGMALSESSKKLIAGFSDAEISKKVFYMSLIRGLLHKDDCWSLPGFKVSKKGLVRDATKVGHSEKLKFRPSMRVLMCILLAKADQVGVVSGLGHADLRRLTGMKRDKLVSHLSKLEEIGFIRFSFAGVTSGELFGVIKGEYILNLDWSGYKRKILPSIVTVYVSPQWSEGFTEEASGLFKQAKSIGLSSKNDADGVDVRGYIPRSSAESAEIEVWAVFKNFTELAKPFFTSSKINIDGMLQWKIEKCASDILSKYLSRLPLDNDQYNDSILDSIAKDLLPTKYKSQVVKLIYDIARSIANFIGNKLLIMERKLLNEKMNIYKMHHLLLPKAIDRDLMSFCLVSYPKRTSILESQVLFIEGGESKPNRTRVISLEDIPNEVKVKYRL